MEYAVGIDIGGTRTKIGLVNIEKGTVCERKIVPTEKQSEEVFLNQMLQEVSRLKKAVPEGGRLKGIGVAASGYVHGSDGKIDEGSSTFIPFFSGYPLKDKIEKSTGLACIIGNDAQLICYGECVYGAGRGYNNILMLTLGTGVGIGIVKGNEPPLKPALVHMAGHIKVKDKEDGVKCYCGIRGCLEQACSGQGLERIGIKCYNKKISPEKIFENAWNGDRAAKDCIDEYIQYLTEGLNQYVYLYAPDLFILGGGIAKSLKHYLPVIHQKVVSKVYTGYKVDVKVCELYEDGGILGAAALTACIAASGENVV